jgi:hypothetical protein
VRAIPAHIVLAALVRRQLLPAILAVSSASQLPQTQVPVAALQEQEKIASLTLDLLYSLGFDEEDCLKALRGMIRAIDGHGRAESQTAQDNGKAAPATPGTPTDGGHEEPAFTPARNDGGHVGTPPVIPTPTALFPGSPTHKDEPAWAQRMGAEGKRVWRPMEEHDDPSTASWKPKRNNPRAKRSTWDTGPPPAATDAQGKSGPIRQPPAVGERVVAVDATAMARPQVEKVTAPCADLQIRQRR